MTGRISLGAFLAGLLLGLSIVGTVVMMQPKADVPFCIVVGEVRATEKVNRIEFTQNGCVMVWDRDGVKAGACAPMAPIIFERGECK